MDGSEDGRGTSNREKKVAGRAKRRKYVQGTRSYLHALTNSVSRRAKSGESEKQA